MTEVCRAAAVVGAGGISGHRGHIYNRLFVFIDTTASSFEIKQSLKRLPEGDRRKGGGVLCAQPEAALK